MSFTARHYNSIQRIIREERTRCEQDKHRPNWDAEPSNAVRNVQEQLGRMLAADNPRFDLTRYNLECEPK